MSLVSILKTDDYRQETLDGVIAAHFETLGVAQDLRPGMRVTLKPNLIMARRPEQSATTHPDILFAVANWLRDHGIDDITVADSPGGPYMAANLRNVYAVSGLKKLEGTVKLNVDCTWRELSCPDTFKNKSFNIIEPIAGADYIINLSKLKTHSMTLMSGGIKNMFGSIPGLQKPEMHYQFPDLRDFSNMLLELALLTKPNITVIDAVDAMEGNGPTSGVPRHMGLTFASRDVFAQDYAAARLMGIDPNSVMMLRLAVEKGLIVPESIELTGDKAAPAVPPFKLPDSKRLDFLDMVPTIFRKPFSATVGKLLRPVPQLNADKCVGCGKCAESCPPKVISMKNGKASFRAKGCISCFCCQELCPQKAISVCRRLKR